MENEKEKINISLSEEVASGTYCNLCVATHDDHEFIIDFVQTSPGVPVAIVKSRIIMHAGTVKRLISILSDQMVMHELNKK